MRLHAGFLLALIAGVGLYVLIARTVARPGDPRGRRQRARRALCRHPGDARHGRRSALLSGRARRPCRRLRGRRAEGQSHRSICRAGFGYAGIVVAMIAVLDPLGVVPAAIFVAGIFVGADTMSRDAGVSNYIADLIVALALLSLVGGLFMRLPRYASRMVAAGYGAAPHRAILIPRRRLLGRGHPHRHAADLRHARRAALRARRRAQPRHRGHLDRRRHGRLAHASISAGSVDRRRSSRR